VVSNIIISMLATSVVDPLLTSPQRARQHDDDMAAIQKSLQDLPPLNLPRSSVAVSIASSSLTLSHRQEEGAELSLEVAAKDEEEVEPRQGGEDVAYNDTMKDYGAEEEDDDNVDIAFQQLMNRGNYLRQLRLLALADEQERQAQMFAQTSFCEEKKEDFDDDDNIPATGTFAAKEVLEDSVRILPTQEKVLDYNSYLAHQRYYDDLKHVDIKYMDFGNIKNPSNGKIVDGDEDSGRLVVEQRKALGKGGFCWDAGFVLGEHVIAHEKEWNDNNRRRQGGAAPRVVELGAGTGLSGMMIAKTTQSRVEVTDLPELEDLMRDNINLNFEGVGGDESYAEKLMFSDDEKKAKGTISSRVLRWGVEEDYGDVPYDVIIGADIVTSLYDPVALAQTLHALSGPDTRIYISGKSRLDKPHEEFDVEMNRLFGSVRKIERPSSRLRSPNVFIIVAEGKQ